MNYAVVSHDRFIEEVLVQYKTCLGNDYDRYRNHVYRVYNYSLWQLGLSASQELALAAAFHDLGIWTDNTFDYLDPSIRCMLSFLEGEDVEMVRAIGLIIYWHHKRTAYSGVYEDHVEAFRKADWMDVTLGIKSCGIPSALAREIRKQFPYSSFHLKLVTLSIREFFRHPTNPLPMFRP